MRWREVKKGKKKESNDFANPIKTSQKKAPFYLSQRIIAFITDMFMVNMPILYIATYVVLGSKEAFLGNQGVIFICVLLFGAILSLLFSRNGQSLGYRYVRLKLVRDTQKSTQPSDYAEQVPNFFIAFLRYILWIISVASIFGILMAYFRKDSKALYDIICRTKVIAIKEPPKPEYG